MIRINIHNYEAYLLDFSEGNLSDEYQLELELFLIQNPQINIDLCELSFVKLENDPINFSNKNSLKKTESHLVSENQFIGYIENQLLIDERLMVEKSCAANPILLKELGLYKKTIVTEDKSVIYLNKGELKRKPKIIWFNFSATQFAAAASVIFLFGLFIFWSKMETATGNSSFANKIIKESLPTKKSIANNIITSRPGITKIIAGKTPNINEKTISIAHKSIVTRAHLPLVKNITILSNENMLSVLKDSASNLTLNNSPIENFKNETIISQNDRALLKQNTQTIVDVITENDEEAITLNSNKKKTGIWETVSRTLKNLNHLGVKYVNGDEKNNKENTSYALTLGSVSITHKAGNL